MSKYQTVTQPLAGQIRGEDIALALGWDPDAPPKPGTGLMTPPRQLDEEGLAIGQLQIVALTNTQLGFYFRGLNGTVYFGDMKLKPITTKDADHDHTEEEQP